MDKRFDKLVKEYNNSYHRTIKMKPVDASKKSNENIVRKNYNFEIINKKQKISIGDKVRISLLKNTFEKGYISNWSEQIDLNEYKKLLKNKRKMFDMTFLTPESLSKYRNNDNKIDQKI